MKDKQGLIDNNYSEKITTMSYFIWDKENDTRWHENNQIKIMYV
jgi:hypothetical protein